MEQQILGIDIGGTFVKFGIIDAAGKISHFKKVPTSELIDQGGFAKNFMHLLELELEQHKSIKKIGIGVPGTLSHDRQKIIEVPAIPDLNGLSLGEYLHKSWPNHQFFLENDANAAALGELYFSDKVVPDHFIFITLGTGVGGAAIINRQIFKGGDGNSMEVGHMVSQQDRSLERNIGKKGMLELAANMLESFPNETVLKNNPMGSQMLIKAADQGDLFSKAVFDEVGKILGKALVSVIRVLDIKTVIIGGGLSASFDHIIGSVMQVMNEKLSPYYLDKIQIMKASLENDAGMIGAAALGFDETDRAKLIAQK